MSTRHTSRLLALLIASTLTGCGGGGGGGSTTPAATSYDVTATAGTGGSIDPTRDSAAEGDILTFTVAPDNGYVIDAVDSTCGGSLDGTTFTTGEVSADCEITASFLPTYGVTAAAGTDGGSISPDVLTVKQGATAQFTLSPDTASGYIVDTVDSTCGGSLDGNTYTAGPVSAACEVTASFKLDSYSVSIAATPGGTVEPAGATVVHGQQAVFTVTPDSDFTLAGISGCGVTATGPNQYTTEAITGVCTVDIRFDWTAAATAPVLGADIKQLTFDWPVSGASYYRVLENVDAASGYEPVGGDMAVPVRDIAVHEYDGVDDLYMLEACNAVGCVSSDTVGSTLDDYIDAIGYVKAPVPAENDLFGHAVALSDDGTTLAVGAPAKRDSDSLLFTATHAGSVNVYARVDGAWVHQQTLPSPGAVDDFFGSTVALSADGNTLAVGAATDDSGNPADPADAGATDAGAVYLYTRDASGTWGEPVYLKAPTIEAGALFGHAVALSHLGDVLAVGTPGARDVAVQEKVYLFPWGDGGWGEPVVVANPKSDNDGFGYALDLSGDGSTLAVGAYAEKSLDAADADNNVGTDVGAVWVFASADNWTTPAYLKATLPQSNTRFGRAVTLSDSGGTLVVGAYEDDTTATDAGAAYLFTRAGGSWSGPERIQAPNVGAGDEFGVSVALSGDGTRLAVGAWLEDSPATGIGGDQGDDTLNASNSGAVYVHQLEGGAVAGAPVYVKAPDTMWGDSFGTSVALDSSGKALAVGSEERSNVGIVCASGEPECVTAQSNGDANDAGAVYLY